MVGLLEILTTLKTERERLQRDLRSLDIAVGALEGLAKKIRGKRQRKLSAGARRRIATAQKARWAKWKAKKARTKSTTAGSWGGPLKG